MKEVRKQVSYEVRNRAWVQIDNQVHWLVKGLISYQVLNPVRDRVDEQVHLRVWNQVWYDELWNKSITSGN